MEESITVYICGSTNKHATKSHCGYGVYFKGMPESNNIADPFLIEPISAERATLYAIYTTLDKLKNENTNKIDIHIKSDYCMKYLKKLSIKIIKSSKNRDVLKLIMDTINSTNIQIVFTSINIEDTQELECIKKAQGLSLEGAKKSIEFFGGIDKKRKVTEKKIIATTSIEEYTYDNDNKEYIPSDIRIVPKTSIRRGRKKKIILDI